MTISKSFNVYNTQHQLEDDTWLRSTYVALNTNKHISNLHKFRKQIPRQYEIGLLDGQGHLIFHHNFRQPQWDTRADTQFWHALTNNNTEFTIYSETKGASAIGTYKFVLCTQTCNGVKGRYTIGETTVSMPLAIMAAAPQITQYLWRKLNLYSYKTNGCANSIRLYSSLPELPLGTYALVTVGVKLGSHGCPTESVAYPVNSGTTLSVIIPACWVRERKTIYANIQLRDQLIFEQINWNYTSSYREVVLVTRTQ